MKASKLVLFILLIFPSVIIGKTSSNSLMKPGANFGSDGLRKLQNENYIIVTYESTADYPNGFNPTGGTIRKGVSIYINGKASSNFTVNANEQIEIHFNSSVEDLTSFFDSETTDSNANKISSVDFSHFDSSSLKNVYKMFNGCTSLKEINFLNFDISHITTMESWFYNCAKIESLDF